MLLLEDGTNTLPLLLMSRVLLVPPVVVGDIVGAGGLPLLAAEMMEVIGLTSPTMTALFVLCDAGGALSQSMATTELLLLLVEVVPEV